MKSKQGSSEDILAADVAERQRSLWRRLRNSKERLAALILGAIALLALILGLSIGLTKRSSGHDHHAYRSPSILPSEGLDDSSASIRQQGSYFTASQDDSALFEWSAQGNPLNLSVPNDRKGFDVVINTSKTYQTMDGFGAALTDSAAYLLHDLRSDNSTLYQQTLKYTFNRRTGASIIRVPLGSSDYSFKEYTYSEARQAADVDSKFNFDPPEYLLDVIRDIRTINPSLKVMLSPWSAPTPLKTSNSLNGGYLRGSEADTAAQYYARAIKAFSDNGVPIWSFTVQNEPSHNAAYPSTLMTAQMQNQIAGAVRRKLASTGLSSVKIYTHDDNFDVAASGFDSIKADPSAVDGIALHCYRGSPSDVDALLRNMSSAGFAQKELHMTECSGTQQHSTTAVSTQERWDGMSWWLQNIFFALPDRSARSVILWNWALTPDNGPHLESAYCANCTGPLTISAPKLDSVADRHVYVNLQSYLLQHFAVASTDLTPWQGSAAARTDTTRGTSPALTGQQMDCLAFQSYTANTKDGKRVGLVLQNSCDTSMQVKVAVGDRGGSLDVEPGLHTFIWLVQ